MWVAKGQTYVIFPSTIAALKVIQHMDGQVVNGQVIQVQMADAFAEMPQTMPLQAVWQERPAELPYCCCVSCLSDTDTRLNGEVM